MLKKGNPYEREGSETILFRSQKSSIEVFTKEMPFVISPYKSAVWVAHSKYKNQFISVLNSQAITETIAKINDQKIQQDLPMN